MIFSNSLSETDDLIVERLSKGESTVKDMFNEVHESHPVTLQATYKAVNKLIKQEVIAKVGKKISLSKEWINKVRTGLGEGIQLPKLNDGESLTFSFNSFEQQDIFWKHLMLLVQEEVGPRFPVFFVDPHEMFLFLRPESQREYLQSFAKDRRYGFMTLGGNSFGDKEYRKEFESEYFQVNFAPGDIKKRHVHIVVIGDFISETIVTPEMAQKIDELYEKDTNLEVLTHGVKDLFKSKNQVRMRFSRNAERASRLRRRLAKPFFIPVEIKKEFKLFRT